MKIRNACKEDAKQLIAIYAPYVEKTAITFEYQVPSLEEFEERIEKTKQKFPYLVAEEEGILQGYAYASAYYNRAAYDWTVELSIYIREKARGKHIGSQLYASLERNLQETGFVNLLVCIALPNNASLTFHKKHGYEQVAHFKKVGYKFDKWHDIVWMQKRLLD
ncbi:GNAT family N-acetyltransferase [Streptococcus mutans]|jgi:putative acetyltransferase|uniref:GNAT family N-acetyltransferase n=1 Tax=Streptococcus mutans TaxID=1309 RepID=UPI0001B0566C|nr:GNAT family N-acetyltransferase [Streptococcus mutans]EMB77172.1 putative acetyltransferase [Streptococcus mutans 2VS1]EMC07155.1 putative acetyltransferase [Streptococcus mutans NLML4]EMC08980.1 putative acetyltransferase [Streptococcus mutans NLML9]EMC35841.1 putative acetyltransferase [Streptococcus mutans 14D]EMP66141.1 acetyltransferase [Streptococcus mutans AC4446]